MPTYDYCCENCGDKFEHFQSMTSSPLKKCKKCGERSLRRLIGAGAGVIFKGSGFYETDYRSESYKKGKESSKTAVKSESSKSEKKEVKKEKKTETKSAGADNRKSS
jgi:putative FmdB family regulatory protein